MMHMDMCMLNKMLIVSIMMDLLNLIYYEYTYFYYNIIAPLCKIHYIEYMAVGRLSMIMESSSLCMEMGIIDK